MWDSIWINANIATMDTGEDHRAAYAAIENGAIGIKDEKIVWVGSQDELSDKPENLAREIHDAGSRWITPGLIDCHTHLVYGGNRAAEFEMRLNGASYADIAKAGGGIISTVKATRAATEDELYEEALKRLLTLMKEGVTGIEIKSGYGLDTDTEAKMLRVATKLRDHLPIDIQRTFLGAHAIPPEFKERSDAYIDIVCREMIPTIAQKKLCDAVDGFCENIAFNTEQIELVFKAARKYGLPVKLHAEQLSDQGGTKLAARYQALSADHLEYLDEDGIIAMKDSGTVAVILPGAFYFLRETQKPPIDLFRKHNVPMAIATDLNPGSSPVHSLLLMMNMACTLFHMTPEETLAAVTRYGAKALGWEDRGIIKQGYHANLTIWDIEQPAELSYKIGYNPCYRVVQNGTIRKRL